MTMDKYEAAAELLARTIIRAPSGSDEILHEPLRFAAGEPAIRLNAFSPWDRTQFAKLSGLFSWEGVAGTIDRGLFGTSVGVGSGGEPHIRVYATFQGESWFRNQILPDFFKSQGLEVLFSRVGRIEFAGASCAGGDSVGPLNGTQTGTLGAWLKKYPSQEIVGISNNHVLADFNNLQNGHPVTHPGPADGGGAGDVIGELAGLVTLKQDNGLGLTTNFADVAWIAPTDLAKVTQGIGPTAILPQGEADLLDAYRKTPGSVDVWLSGRSSQQATGTVSAIRAHLFISDNGKSYHFEDQLELTMSHVAHGDSGSLVITQGANNVGGLFFAIDAGSSSTGFANPWHDVRASTGLDFSYS